MACCKCMSMRGSLEFSRKARSAAETNGWMCVAKVDWIIKVIRRRHVRMVEI